MSVDDLLDSNKHLLLQRESVTISVTFTRPVGWAAIVPGFDRDVRTGIERRKHMPTPITNRQQASYICHSPLALSLSLSFSLCVYVCM